MPSSIIRSIVSGCWRTTGQQTLRRRPEQVRAVTSADFDGAFRRAFRLESDRAARRRLSFGQTVNLVVHHDIRDVHIATDGVNRMSHSDRKTVSVSAGGDDCRSRLAIFNPWAIGKRPPMDAVKTVGDEYIRKCVRSSRYRIRSPDLPVPAQRWQQRAESRPVRKSRRNPGTSSV